MLMAGMMIPVYGLIVPVFMQEKALGILTFMHAWNEFPFTRVLIVKEELKTIPVGLTYFTSQYTTNYTLLLAALTLSTLPLLLLYLFSFRNIMKGMMAGAVKG